MIQVDIHPNFLQNQNILKINFKPQGVKNINIADTISFSGNSIQLQKGNLDGELKQKVTDLVNNSGNYKVDFEGAKGKAYKISADDKNVVIKIAKDKENTGMSEEADILDKLPSSIKKTGQNFIAYGLNKDGYEFLVTNLVEGKNDTVPQNKKQLESLILENFIELDKAGILHDDIGEANILINSKKNQANLIDYGYSKEYDIFNGKDKRIPDNLMLNSNLTSFEVGGLGDYLVKLTQNEKPEEARAFFKDYLEVKADYHGKRVEFLKTELIKRNAKTGLDTVKIKDCIHYENTLSKVLKNPSDEIIDLEALRVQLLYSFSLANKQTFFNKPTNAANNWMKTLIYARKYKDTIQKKLNNYQKNDDMKKYLKFQNQYADFYLKTFNDWGGDTIKWMMDIFSNTGKKLITKEQNIFDNGMQNPLSQSNIGVQYPDTIDIEGSIKKQN